LIHEWRDHFLPSHSDPEFLQGQLADLCAGIDLDFDGVVIAVLNGAAAGYGLDLALGADLRLMASSAMLLPGFAKRGVVPESGGTWYLPRLLGWAKAAEISYLGRDIDAAEAERIGLVNRVVPAADLQTEALNFAQRLAAGAPLAVRYTKLCVNKLIKDALNIAFDTSTALELVTFQSADHQEALAALREKRPPKFEGR
jgi:enoyl-CoA hydratase/carnithine racemase